MTDKTSQLYKILFVCIISGVFAFSLGVIMIVLAKMSTQVYIGFAVIGFSLIFDVMAIISYQQYTNLKKKEVQS